VCMTYYSFIHVYAPRLVSQFLYSSLSKSSKA
jgi:hypothetical protein